MQGSSSRVIQRVQLCLIHVQRSAASPILPEDVRCVYIEFDSTAANSEKDDTFNLPDVHCTNFIVYFRLTIEQSVVEFD